MEAVFISKLKPFLDAVAASMELYVPKKSGGHYVFFRYAPENDRPIELNTIRACTPVKEFLFPVCELAATYPQPTVPQDVKPFAVFGLKDCDLRSIMILDKVFAQEDFQDPLYMARRRQMFIISSDCYSPAETCFCNLFDGKGFCEKGFDLNLSMIKEGFIIEAGSKKGSDFIKKNPQLFADVPRILLAERDKNRSGAQQQLERNTAEFELNGTTREIVHRNHQSDIFDAEARNCVECQACTRVCPTCHCFYLYDVRQKDYFAKMKMWDSCMRFSYAAVAGGANPNKILGDRLKNRLLHKFVYFPDRYGIEMCVGCGRCVDADAGGMDLRIILKKLGAEPKDRNIEQAKVAQ